MNERLWVNEEALLSVREETKTVLRHSLWSLFTPPLAGKIYYIVVMGVSENYKGLILAVCSSGFIGASFILKKKGLKRAASRGTRAGTLTFSSIQFNSIQFTFSRFVLLLVSCDFHFSIVLRFNSRI
jgi:hypothetical protein